MGIQRQLGSVDRESIVRLIVLEEVADQQRHKLGVGVLVDFAGARALPLEARRLLHICICIVLDGLEDTRSELGSKTSESALLLEVLDHYVFQIVHFKLNFNLEEA